MSIVDLFIETFSAFNANRARSFLTVLGVIIGISAVIAMTALIGGVKASLVGEMGLSQAQLVAISCDYGRAMTLNDVRDMSDALSDSFEAMAPLSHGTAEVTTSKEKANGMVRGTSYDYGRIRDLKFAQGRFFNKSESDAARPVIVINLDGVKKLFGSETAQAVGQSVRIGGIEFEIVGVIDDSSGEGNIDNITVFMPFLTSSQRVVGNTNVDQVYGLARENVDPEKAADAAREWLIDRFHIPESSQEDAVYISTMKSFVEQLNSVIASFQVLMTVVASVSLLVGGIGIMNMMLTNVTERIREIGLRKALGARRRDITRQFLLESIILTMTGGVFGILLGYLGAYGMSSIAASAFMGEDTTLTPVIGIDTVLMVASICIIIGIVFGYYPARRAAKLDPVESLHYQ